MKIDIKWRKITWKSRDKSRDYGKILIKMIRQKWSSDALEICDGSR